jgi:hypothetical protein
MQAPSVEVRVVHDPHDSLLWQQRVEHRPLRPALQLLDCHSPQLDRAGLEDAPEDLFQLLDGGRYPWLRTPAPDALREELMRQRRAVVAAVDQVRHDPLRLVPRCLVRQEAPHQPSRDVSRVRHRHPPPAIARLR